MKAAFRVDASLQIGSGHVMRCLTLAEALRANGAECHFITRDHPGHLLELIRHHDFTVAVLPAEPLPAPSNTQVPHERAKEPAHAKWLGSDWKTDADQTRAVLAQLQPDWLVVDHYALDQRWENALRPNFKQLLVIDDLADRSHQCELWGFPGVRRDSKSPSYSEFDPGVLCDNDPWDRASRKPRGAYQQRLQ